MKTIQTKPDCTLGFVKCPEGYTNMSWIVPNGSKSTSKEIGRLSEITEDQAKELVKDPEYVGIYPMYKCYRTPDKGPYLSSRSSLYSAAQSVGIEEKDFDKYLVVKL